jgi:hypothetical protein
MPGGGGGGVGGKKGRGLFFEGSTLCYCCQGFKCNWGFFFKWKETDSLRRGFVFFGVNRWWPKCSSASNEKKAKQRQVKKGVDDFMWLWKFCPFLTPIMTARRHDLGGGGGAATLGPLVLNAISPEERAARLTLEKVEAENRLKEAEARLREAIEELHFRQTGTTDASSVAFSGRHPLCQHGDSCVANAVGSLCQSFLLAYGVRVGIGVLLRAFKLVKKRPYSVLDLKVIP